MQGILLGAAAVSTLTALVVHTFVGGEFVARPLLADTSLPRASKWVNYYCWHIATVMMVYLATAFAWLAFATAPAAVIAFLSSFTTVLSCLSAAVAMRGGIHPLRLPATSLFALTSILGWLALLSGG